MQSNGRPKTIASQVEQRECHFINRDEWAAIAALLRLSERENQIALCILDDDREDVIAARIGISSHTVHSHLERLYRKLGARSRCQVVVKIFKTFRDLQSRI